MRDSYAIFNFIYIKIVVFLGINPLRTVLLLSLFIHIEVCVSIKGVTLGIGTPQLKY